MKLYIHSPYAFSHLKQRDRFTLTSPQLYFCQNFVVLGNYLNYNYCPGWTVSQKQEHMKQYYKISAKIFTNCAIGTKLTQKDNSHIPQQIWRSMGTTFCSASCTWYSLCRAHSTQTLCNSTCLCHTHDLLRTTERAKFFCNYIAC